MNILRNVRNWLVVLMLGIASSAQAVVVMTDGTLVTYDPTETYIPSGVIGGSEIFSIGWIYTSPTYSNSINLSAPSDLVGQLEWALSAGIDATGLRFDDGVLLAGESDAITIGPTLTASLTNPVTAWFSMAAFDMPTPVAFGPTVGGDLISLPAVPEPSTAWMFAVALFAVAAIARRKLLISHH